MKYMLLLPAKLTALLLLCASGAVMSSTRVSPPDPATAEAAAGMIESGRLSSVDVARGVLVFKGQTYRLDPRQVAFSDDRKDPGKGGLQSLKAGDTVILRSIRKNGVSRVLQLVVRD